MCLCGVRVLVRGKREREEVCMCVHMCKSQAVLAPWPVQGSEEEEEGDTEERYSKGGKERIQTAPSYKCSPL